jgi:hypothetical protein
MASGLSRFGRPAALACNLGTSGTLANHTPGSAYAGTFSVTNRVGNVTAELVSSTPALPAGWSLAVNQATGVVTLAWPAGTPAGALPNLGFEAGDDGSWRRGNRWVIDSSPLVETGTQSAKYDGGGQSSMTHSQAVPVTPGTTITATARFSKGTTREDFAGGGISLFWLDANGNFISASRGNVVNTGSAAFQNSTVTGTAPAGAALVTMELSATRDLKGRARDKVYVDNVSWDHSYAIGGGQATNYAVVIRVRDGRGCQATLSQTIPQGAPQTLALLHFNGTNGSTAFPDDTGRVWTRSGNTQVTTTNPRFGTGAGLFDGAGDWLETPAPSEINPATDNFTIEFWFRATVGAFRVMLRWTNEGSQVSNGLRVWINSDGRVEVQSQQAIPVSTDGQWHHFALQHGPAGWRYFIDGQAQITPSSPISAFGSAIAIGRGSAGLAAPDFNGAIDEFRISRGHRYSMTGIAGQQIFTPPTSPFTLD